MKWFFWTLLLCWMMATSWVNATELAETSVKIDRQKNGESPLPILITVKTGRNVTEDGVKIIVGKGWTFDNPVISTINLPIGVNAWPGLNISSVNVKNLNLNSSDLTSNNTYGFYIVSGISNNPTTLNEMDWLWSVETIAGGMVDAKREVMVPLVANDQITITGQVSAKVRDFQLALSMLPIGIKKQNEATTFKINYGSYLTSSAKPLVISAVWSKGTIDGSPIATIDGLDYVVGSATVGFGDAMPVIDVVNRKITWTINSFPANELNQEISFSLRTNENYSGSSKVNYQINAQLRGLGVTTGSENKILVFQRGGTDLIEPTGIQTGVQTVPTGIATTVPKIILENILINQLRMNNGQLEIETNVAPDLLTIKYGTKPNQLNKSLTSINKLSLDWFDIADLEPGKDYYFYIEAIKGDFKSISDLYTFRTPLEEAITVVDANSLSVISDNLVITDTTSGGKPEAVLPQSKVYTVKVNLNNSDYKELVVELRLESDKVLGISTVYGAEPSTLQSFMVQATGKACTTQLVSPAENGYYGVYLRIYELNGSITETKIANLRVIGPIKILNIKKNPIEGASILISKFDENLKVYKNLPSLYKGFPNPGVTDTRGELSVPLATGNYQIEISAFEYNSVSTRFAVGFGAGEIMPIVTMTEKKVSIADRLSDISKISRDVVVYFSGFVNGLSESGRFFKLVEIIQIAFSLCLIAVIVGRLNGIDWWIIPWLMGSLVRPRSLGKVIDELTNKRIFGAVVFFNNEKTKTNLLGEFNFKPKVQKDNYEVKVLALNYYGKTMEYSKDALDMGNIDIRLEKIENGNQYFRIWGKEAFELLGGVGVIIFLIGQLLFLYKLSPMTVLPFLVLALLDLIIWGMIVLKIERKNVV